MTISPAQHKKVNTMSKCILVLAKPRPPKKYVTQKKAIKKTHFRPLHENYPIKFMPWPDAIQMMAGCSNSFCSIKANMCDVTVIISISNTQVYICTFDVWCYPMSNMATNWNNNKKWYFCYVNMKINERATGAWPRHAHTRKGTHKIRITRIVYVGGPVCS